MIKPVCIIPARGGSKRLPRKNILKVNGKSLLSRAIYIAQSSGVFSDILVSSDDPEMLLEAERNKVTPVIRPSQLASDTASVVDVCVDILSDIHNSHFCCLYATSVLIKPTTLRKAYQEFVKNNNDETMLMGVTQYKYHPFKALELNDVGIAKPVFPEFQSVKSQQLPNLYVSNGSFYWANRENFLKEKSFYGSSLKLYPVAEDEVCDIDTPEDFTQMSRKILAREGRCNDWDS